MTSLTDWMFFDVEIKWTGCEQVKIELATAGAPVDATDAGGYLSALSNGPLVTDDVIN